ncbi:hypothetical protein AGIG_G23323 [Arapaima gigas]
MSQNGAVGVLTPTPLWLAGSEGGANTYAHSCCPSSRNTDAVTLQQKRDWRKRVRGVNTFAGRHVGRTSAPVYSPKGCSCFVPPAEAGARGAVLDTHTSHCRGRGEERRGEEQHRHLLHGGSPLALVAMTAAARHDWCSCSDDQRLGGRSLRDAESGGGRLTAAAVLPGRCAVLGSGMWNMGSLRRFTAPFSRPERVAAGFACAVWGASCVAVCRRRTEVC